MKERKDTQWREYTKTALKQEMKHTKHTQSPMSISEPQTSKWKHRSEKSSLYPNSNLCVHEEELKWSETAKNLQNFVPDTLFA